MNGYDEQIRDLERRFDAGEPVAAELWRAYRDSLGLSRVGALRRFYDRGGLSPESSAAVAHEMQLDAVREEIASDPGDPREYSAKLEDAWAAQFDEDDVAARDESSHEPGRLGVRPVRERAMQWMRALDEVALEHERDVLGLDPLPPPPLLRPVPGQWDPEQVLNGSDFANVSNGQVFSVTPLDRVGHGAWVVRFRDAPMYLDSIRVGLQSLPRLNEGPQFESALRDPSFLLETAILATGGVGRRTFALPDGLRSRWGRLLALEATWLSSGHELESRPRDAAIFVERGSEAEEVSLDWIRRNHMTLEGTRVVDDAEAAVWHFLQLRGAARPRLRNQPSLALEAAEISRDVSARLASEATDESFGRRRNGDERIRDLRRRVEAGEDEAAAELLRAWASGEAPPDSALFRDVSAAPSVAAAMARLAERWVRTAFAPYGSGADPGDEVVAGLFDRGPARYFALADARKPVLLDQFVPQLPGRPPVAGLLAATSRGVEFDGRLEWDPSRGNPAHGNVFVARLTIFTHARVEDMAMLEREGRRPHRIPPVSGYGLDRRDLAHHLFSKLTRARYGPVARPVDSPFRFAADQWSEEAKGGGLEVVRVEIELSHPLGAVVVAMRGPVWFENVGPWVLDEVVGLLP